MTIAEAISAATERLSTQWPVVLTAVLACAAAWLVQKLLMSNPYSKIPLVGGQIGNEEKRRAAYMGGAKDILLEGYNKFKNGVFKVTTIKESPVVIVAPRFLQELKTLSDDVVSFSGAIEELMHSKWTNIQANRVIVPYVVKRDLTPALGRLNPILAEEIDLAFQMEFPPCKEFTKVPLNHRLLRIVSKASGRIFVGSELGRSEEYIDMGINYTIETVAAAQAISFLPPHERDAKAGSLPEVKVLQERLQNSYKFIRPIIEARRKSMRDDPDFQKPDDIIQWVLDDGQEKYGEQSDQELTEIQLNLTFAAIHTTTMSTTNAFYSLAAMPEVAPMLREEIRTVLKEYGTFTTAALQKMKKLDSFMREVFRVYPLSWVSFNRKVRKSFVLSNGQVIPAGCIILVPAYGAMNDPELIEGGDRFDPLRWYNLREREELKGVDKATAGALNQVVTVSPSNLTFGYGRHACPGRFFAVNEIKMIVGRAVLDYDIKLDGSKERYPNISIGEDSLPDPSKDLLFKRVAV